MKQQNKTKIDKGLFKGLTIEVYQIWWFRVIKLLSFFKLAKKSIAIDSNIYLEIYKFRGKYYINKPKEL